MTGDGKQQEARDWAQFTFRGKVVSLTEHFVTIESAWGGRQHTFGVEELDDAAPICKNSAAQISHPCALCGKPATHEYEGAWYCDANRQPSTQPEPIDYSVCGYRVERWIDDRDHSFTCGRMPGHSGQHWSDAKRGPDEYQSSHASGEPGQPFDIYGHGFPPAFIAAWEHRERQFRQEKREAEQAMAEKAAQLVAKWRETGKVAEKLDKFKFVSTVATGETLIACADELEAILGPRTRGE